VCSLTPPHHSHCPSTSSPQIQFLYASLASGGGSQRGGGGGVAAWRAALADLKADFERSWKYTGKV
jgi:hypothetical protein